MSATALPATNPDWDVQVAVVAAAAVVAAVLAAIWLGLENPWWAALSAWRVADAKPNNTLWRGVQRVVGTVAGAVICYLVAGIVAGFPVAQAIVLFGAAALATYMRFMGGAWSYAWTMGGITAMLVLVQSLASPEDLYGFAIFRAAEIICGVVVASTVVVLLTGARALEPVPPPKPPAPEERAEIMRVALLGGCAMVLVALLWDAFDVPSVVQIAVSVLVLLDRDMIALRRKGWLRIWGCFCGGAYGLLVMAVGLDAVTLWAAAIMGGLVMFARSALWGGADSYFGLQAGHALLVCLVVGRGPPATLEPVMERFIGILIGVSLTVLLSFILAPPHHATTTAPAVAGGTGAEAARGAWSGDGSGGVAGRAQ